MGTRSPGSIQKTKHMLSEALLSLAEKRSFRKISVGDICQTAMVSRSAFYSHFADKYELLSFALEEKLRLQAPGSQNQTLEGQISALLKSVQENRRAVYHIFMADMSPELMDIFQKTLQTAAVRRLEELQRSGVKLPGDVRLTAAFLVGGLANVIISWIRENCAVPAEEIAKCQCELIAALGAAEKNG